MNDKFKGIMPALMTAFVSNDIDICKVGKLVNRLRNSGVHGLYVGGSSGEMVFCSVEERMKLLEAVKDTAEELTVIAHVGAMSAHDTVKLAKHAESVKADAVSSVTPLYYNYSFNEVKHYYERICNTVSLPMIIYNIPARTGMSLNYEQLSELLSIKGVEGMKFTSSDFFLLNRLKNAFPDKVFFNGSDEMLLSGLAAGADGGIGTTYNFMPEFMLAIFNFFNEGKIDKAYEVQTIANSVIANVIKCGTLPASKQMLEFSGIDYGICREPLLPLGESEKTYLFENAWSLIEKYRSHIKCL